MKKKNSTRKWEKEYKGSYILWEKREILGQVWIALSKTGRKRKWFARTGKAGTRPFLHQYSPTLREGKIFVESQLKKEKTTQPKHS